MTKKKLRKQFKRFSNRTEQPTKLYSGALGVYIGGTQYVDVPDRPGFVYVRLMNDMSQLIQAHNQTVSPVYNLPVLVVRANNRYEIYGRDVEQYGNYWDTTSSYLPRHGTQHSFDPDNNGGGDLVFVHGEQFYPLMGFPSGTDGAGNILIAPYRYYYDSDWHYTGNTGTPDLLQYRPTGSANAKLLLIGLDAPSGNPFVKVGSEFSAGITGAAQLTDYIPTNITPSTEIPGTIVRLVTGTSTITWANIYDARQYMGILQAAVTGSFGGSFLNLNDTPDSYAGQTEKIVVVNNAGTGLEFRTNTGSSGASNFLALTDTPDSYSGQANKFVAVNSGATGLEFVDSPSGAGGSGIVVYDDSVYKVTGSAISFNNGLNVIVTGTTAFISTTREILSAARTYYVRTDGNDSNSGLTNVSGSSNGAFLTIQKAYNTIISLDLNGYDATIKLGNTGIFTAGLNATVSPVGGNVIIEGDTTTASNTIVSTSGNTIVWTCAGTLTVRNFKIISTGYSVMAQGGFAYVSIGPKMDFGTATNGHIRAIGGYIIANNPYTISGNGGNYHYQSTVGGAIVAANHTVTVTGSPSFVVGFATADQASAISAFTIIYSGSAIGPRYYAALNGEINTYGGGANYFPGNSAGSTASGGQYG